MFLYICMYSVFLPCTDCFCLVILTNAIMAAVCKDQRTRINLASRMEKGTVRNVADIKSLFATHKVNVNARNQLGWSPLMIACAKGCKDMVIFLLYRGADLNARSTKGGNTPMHYACLGNHCDCLRGHICNYSVRLESYETKDRIGILRFLISHGATLQCNSDGLDPPLPGSTSQTPSSC